MKKKLSFLAMVLCVGGLAAQSWLEVLLQTPEERARAERAYQKGRAKKAGAIAAEQALEPKKVLREKAELMQRKTPFYKRPGFRAGVGGAAVGATAGWQLSPGQPIEGGLVGGLGVGSITIPIAMAIDYGLNWLQVRHLNNILQKYTNLDFYTLPTEAAMLVLAAYRRDMVMMSTLARRLKTFVSKPGVWEALAHLNAGNRQSPDDVVTFQEFVINQ